MTLVPGMSALVTGAGAGIGRATALRFALEGARVIVSDVNTEGAEETLRLIKQAGAEGIFVKADVSRDDDVRALIAKAVSTYGKLDCACNNAGIEGIIGPLAQQTEENFDHIMAVNARGTFLCLKYEIAQMLKTGGGAIVNLASVAGLRATPHSRLRRSIIAPKSLIAGLMLVAQQRARSVAVQRRRKGLLNAPRLRRKFRPTGTSKLANREKSDTLTGSGLIPPGERRTSPGYGVLTL